MSASVIPARGYISGGVLRRFLFCLTFALLSCFLFLLFSPPAQAVTNIPGGTISQNTEWTAAGSVYVVQGSLTVASGVTLTVDSGVVVKFQSSSTSLTVNGTLNATGAVFTSYKDDAHGGDTNGDGGATQPAPGDWKNIYFSGGGGTLSGCTILYGGYYFLNSSEILIDGNSPNITGSIIGSSQTAGINVMSGSPSITGNTVSNNQGGVAVYLSTQPAALHDNTISGNTNGWAVELPATLGQGLVYNNSYSGNKYNAMFLGGDVSANTTWPASNSPYVIGQPGNEGGGNYTINVTNNSTLTVDTGAIVKFSTDQTHLWNALVVASGSSINATNAIFTSYFDDSVGGDTNADGGATQPKSGDWEYINFNGGTGTLSGCTVKYGGSTWGYGELYVNGGLPTITGSAISNSNQAGIYVASGSPSITGDTVSNNQGSGIYSSTQPAALHDNTISGNTNGWAVELPATLGQGLVYNNSYQGNKYNAMYLGGDVSANTTWPASNSPYVFGQPGNEGGGNYTYNVKNNSTLTVESGVIVKFSTDQIHLWNALVVASGSTLNATNAVFTSFFDDSVGGDTNADGGATQPKPGDWEYINFNGGTGTLSGCIVKYGGSTWGYGELYVSGSSPTITGSAISYSNQAGIYVDSGSPSIHYDDIFANATGINSSPPLDATNNYWGSKHGPRPYGVGNGFSLSVTALPFSRIPFTAAGAAYQATLGTDDYCAICGDPINTATGAFIYQHEDIKVPTKGVPLEFQRTYNSNDQSDGSLGVGWSYSWQISVNPLANGNVVVLRGDGRQDLFTRNPDGSYSPPSSRHDALVKNADGTYRLLTQDQITYNFNYKTSSNLQTTFLGSIVAENGQATNFTYDDSGQTPTYHLLSIKEPTGRTIAISWQSDSTKPGYNRIDHITDPAGNNIAFGYSDQADKSSDLTSVTDQNGNQTTFAYTNHRITSVTDPEGHTSANNTYDTQGRVISQTDADGKLLSFSYDTLPHGSPTPTNYITTMTRQMVPGDSSKDEVTVFTYDNTYRLISELDANGKTTSFTYDAAGNRDSVTDRRGTVTKQVYDPYGNVTDTYKAYGAPEQEHTSYTYNPKNHPLTKTDPRGQTTTYTYDASGSFLTGVTYPAVTNYDNTISHYSEAYTYNADGTPASFTDKNGNIAGFAYDPNGNLQTENKNTNRSPSDQVTLSYSYNPLGLKTSATDGDNHTTTFQYDNVGELRYETKQVTDPGTGQLVDVTTEYQYDKAGNRVKVIDPENKPTSFAYTPSNRLDTVTDALGNTTKYTYDAAGNKTDSKDRNDNWSHFAFDKDNRMVSSKDPENNTTTYGYDEEGNQTSVTDPRQNTTNKTYDRVNRLASLTQPDLNNATRTTSYTYDAGDNLLATTDPLNHTATSVYDELGRLKQSRDALGNSGYTAYDGLGNKLKTKDGLGHETIYTYSPNNFLITVADPAGGVTNYAYDKAGNRTSQTDADNHTTLYSYDELNRLKEEKVDAGGGSYLLDRSYSYDKSGHLKTDVTGAGTISYSYDDVYNLSGETDRQNATYSFTYDNNQNQVTAKDNAANKTVSFTYNPRGLLASATDVFGASENYTYDGAGNLTGRHDTVSGNGFDTSFSYTPRNQMASVTRGTGTSSFTFDAAGNLASKTYPNGIYASYSYDRDNKTTGMTVWKPAWSIPQWYSQQYDANGNIVQKSEGGPVEWFSNTYTYDSLNRLTGETLGGYGTISYGYDHAGNRTSTNNPTTGQTTYSYDQANELSSSVNNGATTNYSYNANGAITGKTTGSNTTSYTYNGLDKLSQVSTPGGSVSYGYDALGRRVRSVEGSDTRNIHLSAKTDLPDYWSDASGAVTASLLRGADGLISFTMNPTQSPFLCYQLYSPHGDTTLITDSSANPFYTARYDAFGNAISGAGLWFGYTGKYERYTDGTTGTVEMGVREYDPTIGRFISADPLKGNPSDPQTINRYPYVQNDPLTRYDLNGKLGIGDVTGWLGDRAQDWKEGYDSAPTWGKVALDADIAVAAVGVTVVTGGSDLAVGGEVAADAVATDVAVDATATGVEAGTAAEGDLAAAAADSSAEGLGAGDLAESGGLTNSSLAESADCPDALNGSDVSYHYGTGEPSSYESNGIRIGEDGYAYTTPEGGYSFPEAAEQLQLDQEPTSLWKVDHSVLRGMNLEIPEAEPVPGSPGNAMQYRFPYRIPPDAITFIR